MKLKTRKRGMPSAEGDLTPMIDMTFQLIAFFMVLVRFAEVDVSEKVQLPQSELAKPAEKPPTHFIWVQVTREHTSIIDGQEVPIETGLLSLLQRQADILRRTRSETGGTVAPQAATVFIRAHKDAPTGDVQKVIELAQTANFEKFALRAEEKQGY